MDWLNNIMKYKITINYIGIIVFIICFLISFFVFSIISYLVVRILRTSIENSFLFNAYNKKCQKILDKYGDWEINRLYLFRRPFSKTINIMLNFITLFEYNRKTRESDEYIPYHTGFIIELKNKKKVKLLLLEKNHCINICENFIVCNNNEIEYTINKCNMTLNNLLKITRKRLGDERYFNWNIFENNCNIFTKEILITLKKFTLEKEIFIKRDKIKEFLEPDDFISHIINSVFIIYKFIENYILDNNLFY